MHDTPAPHSPEVRVWDRFVRIFHWSLVAGFATGFLSGENNLMTLHVWTGYVICALLSARLVWGFIGTPYARFSNFLYPPRETLTYLKGLRAGHPPHYLGHNPAGALMVFALLGLCVCLCLSGMITLATIDFDGPLLFLNRWCDDAMAYLAQDIHQLLPKITLALVTLHVLGVIASSRLHGENLFKSMITGSKPAPLQGGTK